MKTLPRNEVVTGDARKILPTLLPESVDCVVTSPPYFRLRDYGSSGQLGQEATIEEYVENLRAVLQDVRGVLKASGSLWLNLGDSYARSPHVGVPLGSLALVPQRLALALAADGWIVRNVVVWAKFNPLPQSAPDRLSPTYEVVIFAAKTRRYFFDLDAIRLPHRSARRAGQRAAGRRYQGGNTGLVRLKAAGLVGNPKGKNPGDVWSFATATDRRGHQATFPASLIERPILATAPEAICVQCDRPWVRPVRLLTVHEQTGTRDVRRTGALSRCDCFAPTRPGVVMDPFAGTGTTCAVAARLGRDYLGIELSSAYAALARARLGEAEAA